MSDTRPLALVTGGTKRLGAAIAGALAQEGYDLALSTHEDSIELPVDDRLGGVDARAFRSDLSHPDAPQRLFDSVNSEFGRVPTLLINNAAIFGQDDWRQMSAETIDAHMAVNFRAPMLLSKAFAETLPANCPGAIVQIVDQRVRNPIGQQISYGFSKQALAASIRTLAVSLPAHIRTNGVAPGLSIPNPEHSARNIDAAREAMPLNALPKPEDVAAAVLYLARARAVTGQLLFVDCGAHLKSFDSDFGDLE